MCILCPVINFMGKGTILKILLFLHETQKSFSLQLCKTTFILNSKDAKFYKSQQFPNCIHSFQICIQYTFS